MKTKEIELPDEGRGTIEFLQVESVTFCPATHVIRVRGHFCDHVIEVIGLSSSPPYRIRREESDVHELHSLRAALGYWSRTADWLRDCLLGPSEDPEALQEQLTEAQGRVDELAERIGDVEGRLGLRAGDCAPSA